MRKPFERYPLKAIARLRGAALLLALAALAAGPFIPALGQSLPSAKAPVTVMKSARIESLKLSPDAAATPVVLAAPDAAAVAGVKRANSGATLKRLQIGLARAVPATRNSDSAALTWLPVEGGFAARWSVTSAEAKALRVGVQVERSDPTLELRFWSPARPEVVHGPFTEADINAAAGNTYWSPVLEGDTGMVELFVKGDAEPRRLSVRVAEVSHLLANPADPKVDSQLKTAQFCEVNFICRAASDPALRTTGEAVARYVATDSRGSFLCTGTLLNSADEQFVPYFYTADHCIDSQATASTLTTYWFYESLSCGDDSVNPNYVQVGGGATLLYADQNTDVSFMRLNRAAPADSTFAGWDAGLLSIGAPVTAIHHPDGDVKKVSLGTVAGFLADINATGRTGSFIRTNWDSILTGVTEGGSSGSGIFTQANGDYRFRGGLLGGPSSCTSSALYDYYSRFDVAYQNVSQFLGKSAASVANTNYTALWYNYPAESEPGWGINIAQEGDIVFATLFTYGPGGAPLWLVMSRGERQGAGDTFSGPLYQTTAKGNPDTPPWPGATPSQVGTMTIAFTGGDTANLSYSVNGTSVSKTITKEIFAPGGGAACGNTTGSRASATNYTDLWYNAPAESEPGWGINVTHQGSIVFATLFRYRSDGQQMWYVMSRGERQSDGSFTGPLYQMTGNGAFNARPWPGATPSQVGTMTLRFSDGENGTLTYSVNGAATTKQIVRQLFSLPAPLCTG